MKKIVFVPQIILPGTPKCLESLLKNQYKKHSRQMNRYRKVINFKIIAKRQVHEKKEN